MRKLINDPFACVDEMIAGIRLAFPGVVDVTASGRGMVYTGQTVPRRTRIVVGGGSGHEPAFFGYLGPGLADAAAIGNVFASPSAAPAVEVAERLAATDGVLFVYGNYDGDVMNFDMAAEFLRDRGVAVEPAFGRTEEPEQGSERTGVGPQHRLAQGRRADGTGGADPGHGPQLSEHNE